jgi:hypothetical protein
MVQVYFLKKLDSKYMCKGGWWHKLKFMDIHFHTSLWVKGLQIHKVYTKLNWGI